MPKRTASEAAAAAASVIPPMAGADVAHIECTETGESAAGESTAVGVAPAESRGDGAANERLSADAPRRLARLSAPSEDRTGELGAMADLAGESVSLLHATPDNAALVAASAL